MQVAPEDAAKSPSRLTVRWLWAAQAALSVKELQKRLKQQGLDTTGVKTVLVARLRDHFDSAQAEEKNALQDNAEEQQAYLNKGTKAAEVAAAGDVKNAGTQPRRPADAMGSDTQTNVAARLKRDSPDPTPSTEQPSIANVDEPKEAATCSLRIDNFRRPFTLNAVKALVQEFGSFVEDGFWMDTIKTHCYVTYETSEIAKKTRDALDGKVWPPESGIALKAALCEQTAKEISSGRAQNSNPLKRKASSIAQSPHGTSNGARQAFTIDEFFRKTDTKPVLYYLPLTEDQIKQRKQRQRQNANNRGTRS